MSSTEPQCPFCGSNDDCPHLLLYVDTTFRTAEGGILYESFNERWGDIQAAGEEDSNFDETSQFNDLLEVVDGLANATQEYEFEGGPGMSSDYVAYYVSSESKCEEALQRFLGQRLK